MHYIVCTSLRSLFKIDSNCNLLGSRKISSSCNLLGYSKIHTTPNQCFERHARLLCELACLSIKNQTGEQTNFSVSSLIGDHLETMRRAQKRAERKYAACVKMEIQGNRFVCAFRIGTVDLIQFQWLPSSAQMRCFRVKITEITSEKSLHYL